MAKRQRRSHKPRHPRHRNSAAPVVKGTAAGAAVTESSPAGRRTPARARISRTLAALVVTGAVAAAVWYARARFPAEEPEARRDTVAPTERTRTIGRDAAATPLSVDQAVNQATEPMSPYVGSRACAECHEQEYQAWARDWHGKALTSGTADHVVGDFDDKHYTGASSDAWMHRAGDGFTMQTRDREGRLDDYPVHWLIGGKHMQDPLTVLGDGRWQVLPVYYHVDGHAWVDYTEDKQGQLTPDSPFFWENFRRTANRECLDCHSTGLRTRYDRETHTWSSRFADAGVACEACHGPGERHAASQESADIIKPSDLDPESELAVCGQCHGIHRPLFPAFDEAHHFQPGDHYEDRYEMIVGVSNGIADLLSDFFADGRPNTSSYEYLSLLQSACHRKGEATCLSCHTAPHDAHESSEVRIADDAPAGVWSAGDQTCRGCHESVFSAGERHTRHQGASAQSCVACHMPAVLSAVREQFADHALDVPDPENTVRHGIPNACNVCHADRSAQDMAGALARLWPNAQVRQARRRRIADGFSPKSDRAVAAAALRAVLADRDEAAGLRGAAALALAQRFPAQAADIISEHVRDADPLVRAQCIEALAFTKGQAAAQEIERYLDDDSLLVRRSAAITLAGLHAPAGERALRALAADPATATMVEIHLGLALYEFGRHDLDATERSLERAVNLQPYNTSVLLMMADVHLAQNQLGKAHADLEEMLHFAPDSVAAHRRLEQLDARTTSRP